MAEAVGDLLPLRGGGLLDGHDVRADLLDGEGLQQGHARVLSEVRGGEIDLVDATGRGGIEGNSVHIHVQA